MTQSQVTQSQVTQSQVTQSQMTQSQVTQSQVTKSQVTKSLITKSQIANIQMPLSCNFDIVRMIALCQNNLAFILLLKYRICMVKHSSLPHQVLN